MFDKIKEYYDSGAWSIERIYNAVGKVINKTEYKKITGQKYSLAGTVEKLQDEDEKKE